MMSEQQTQDSMEFLRKMWSNMGFSLPGMVTPTFSTLELSKRITDLKAVEGWLRMNLSMLQMTIQGLEMQNATLTAVQAMGKVDRPEETPESEDGATVGEALHQVAMWPWNLMQQMQTHLQQTAEEAAQPGEDAASKASADRKTAASPRKPAAAKKARS